MQPRPQSTTALKSLFMVTLMLLSSQLIQVAEAQQPEIEFSTYGDLLILTQDETSPWITSFDVKNWLETDDLEKSRLSRTRVLTDHNAAATGIAHDSQILYISYDDGTLEIYQSSDGMGLFNHWVRESKISLSPVPNSLALDGGTLLWTTEGSLTAHSVATSTLGSSKPSRNTLEFTDPSLNSGSGLIGIFPSSAPDGSLILNALDDSGSTLLAKNTLSNQNDVVEQRAWIRDSAAPAAGGSSPVGAVTNLQYTDSVDSVHNLILTLDNDAIRLLEAVPEATRTYRIADGMGASQTNGSDLDWAWTGSSDGTTYASTTIQLDNSPMNSLGRCQGMTVSFAELEAFKDASGVALDDATITLDIGGIEKTVRHSDISGKNVEWKVDDEDLLTPDLCGQASESVEFRIVKTSHSDLQAEVSLTSPGPLQRTSVGSNWTHGGITWKHNNRGGFGGLASSATTVFGGAFTEVTSGVFRDLDNPSDQIGGLSMLRDMSHLINIDEIIGASSRLVNAVPIQSVYSPERFTQDKNMWWDVEVDWNPSMISVGNEVKQTLTVELLVRGAECSRYGMSIDPGLIARAGQSSIHSSFEPDHLGNGRQSFSTELLKSWGDCRLEFRDADTWEPVSGSLMTRVVPTQGISDERPVNDRVRVHVLRFEIPLNVDGQGDAVIPFDTNDPESHQFTWIRPAEPDSPRFVSGSNGAGELEWRIIADPDNSALENNEERTDNVGIGVEDTINFGLDEYSILVVRTALRFNECSDWDLTWGGWVCDSRSRHNLAAPSEADALAMIELAQVKMQQMLPIPEGRLNIELAPSTTRVTTTETHTAIPALGNLLQRTVHLFNVIREGVDIAEENDFNRVVMFHDLQAGFSVELDNSVPVEEVNPRQDVRPRDRMFGLMAFAGFCPCSKAVLAGNFKSAEHNADNMIHELGHSMLVGHDNQGIMNHTINNCGMPNARSLELTEGWSPTDYVGLDETQERGVEGASFMRYSSDAEEHDQNFDEADYLFDSTWIQNIDYDLVQDTFGFDAGQDFISAWGSLAIESLSEYLDDWIIGALLAGLGIGLLILAILGPLALIGIASFIIIVLAVLLTLANIILVAGGGIGSIFDLVGAGRSEAASPSHLQYDGFLTPGGEIITNSIQPRMSDDPLFEVSFSETNLSFNQLDAEGNLLRSTPVQSIDETAEALEGTRSIVAFAPFHADAVTYRVSDSQTGGEASGSLGIGDLSQLAFESDGRPQSMASGDTFSLEWSGGDSAVYDVDASWNGGETWFPLSEDQEETHIELSTDDWPATDEALVRVIADDGFSTKLLTTDKIAIQRVEHRVTWRSAAHVSPGDTVSFIIKSNDDFSDCTVDETAGWNLIESAGDANRMRITMRAANPTADGASTLGLTCGEDVITTPMPFEPVLATSARLPSTSISLSDTISGDVQVPTGTVVFSDPAAPFRDSDGDGIRDVIDDCKMSTPDVEIDEAGCELTTDDDGGRITENGEDTSGKAANAGLTEEGGWIVMIGMLTLGTMLGVAISNQRKREEEDDT